MNSLMCGVDTFTCNSTKQNNVLVCSQTSRSAAKALAYRSPNNNESFPSYDVPDRGN